MTDSLDNIELPTGMSAVVFTDDECRLILDHPEDTVITPPNAILAAVVGSVIAARNEDLFEQLKTRFYEAAEEGNETLH